MSKLDQLRAMREANYVTRVTKLALPERAVTIAELKKAIGRPKKHASTAAKQKAYRARRKGNG